MNWFMKPIRSSSILSWVLFFHAWEGIVIAHFADTVAEAERERVCPMSRRR